MSFLRDFLLWNEGNDCPQRYLTWSALGALAIAIGPRVHLSCDYFNVYPNIYVLLVGHSGSRKTFAQDQAIAVLRDAIPDVIISGNCETRQRITLFLSQPAQARTYVDHSGATVEYRPFAVCASELMNYMALDHAGMVNFLVDIYDCYERGYYYNTKTEEHKIEHPYIVMLSCTCPEWLTSQIKAIEFSQGYGRRTIIACVTERQPKRPTISDVHRRARERLVEHLKHLQGVTGVMQMTKEADAWFWSWATSLKPQDDAFLQAWYTTKHINLLKVGMLLALSEQLTLTLELNHLHAALALLDDVESALPMITERMGRSELVEPKMRVLQVLENHGGVMLETELKKITFKEFTEPLEQWRLLQHLQSTGELYNITASDGHRYFISSAVAKRLSDGGVLPGHVDVLVPSVRRKPFDPPRPPATGPTVP